MDSCRHAEALRVATAAEEHWQYLLPMHDARDTFACATVAKGVIVAGGTGLASVEVFDEVLNRWLRCLRVIYRMGCPVFQLPWAARYWKLPGYALRLHSRT